MKQHFQQPKEELQKYSPVATKVNQVFDYNADIWNFSELGVPLPPCESTRTINFSQIHQPWLKAAVKQFIKFNAANRSARTCLKKLWALNKFSRFLFNNYPSLHSLEINRDCILSFLLYLQRELPSPRAIASRNGIVLTLHMFIVLAKRYGWLKLTSSDLIYNEDLPKVDRKAKTIDKTVPAEVMEQLIANMDWLYPPVARMLLIQMECALRVSEVCGMRFDCVNYDATGDPWLKFFNWKLKKEHSPIPITLALAEVIKVQQAYIREHLGKDYDYLFCSCRHGLNSVHYAPICRECGEPACARGYCQKHYDEIIRRRRLQNKEKPPDYGSLTSSFWPIAKPPRGDWMRACLRRLAKNRNITYQGKIWELGKTHRFRHTRATELINQGMPLVMLQIILDHASPEMTEQYFKIYDQTLKDAWKKTAPKMVDITGAVYKMERTKLDEPQYQTLKKQLLEQKVERGICTLEPNQVCPKFFSCYDCAKLRAMPDDLPEIKADRIEFKLEIQQFDAEVIKCRNAGKHRLAEGYEIRAKQLKEKLKSVNNLITGLEARNDWHTP